MKKIILSILAGFLLLSAISLDVSAAKKSSKLSKEAITEMSETIDTLKKFMAELYYLRRIMKV